MPQFAHKSKPFSSLATDFGRSNGLLAMGYSGINPTATKVFILPKLKMVRHCGSGDRAAELWMIDYGRTRSAARGKRKSRALKSIAARKRRVASPARYFDVHALSRVRGSMLRLRIAPHNAAARGVYAARVPGKEGEMAIRAQSFL